MARYGDACNLFASSPDEVAHKLRVLDRHCEAEGRDPATIERTILARGHDSAADRDGFLAAMAEYAAPGISTLEVMPTGDPVAFTTRVMDDVAGRLAEL